MAESAPTHAAAPAFAQVRGSLETVEAPEDVTVTAPRLGPPETQFLVYNEARALVLRSTVSTDERVLAPRADAALYQPALALLWYRDAEALRVLDLRALDAPPVLVARGMPDINRLAIGHPADDVETEDGCDLDSVQLNWSDTPSISPTLSRSDSIVLDGVAWLRANLNRARQELGRRREFGSKRLTLPKGVRDCDDRELCGTEAPFLAPEITLVRVRDKTGGGDCRQRACLLRNARTGKFASPPRAQSWSSAGQALPGSCGPFSFDATNSAYLQDATLCLADHACSDVRGHALGWVVPGDVVGLPGLLP